MKFFFTTAVICIFTLILNPQKVIGQFVCLNGYIIDAESGKSLKNINIYESQSDIGTISNDKGYFRLVLSPGNLNLTFDASKYLELNKEFTLDSDTLIYIRLNSDKIAINDSNVQVKSHKSFQTEIARNKKDTN